MKCLENSLLTPGHQHAGKTTTYKQVTKPLKERNISDIWKQA